MKKKIFGLVGILFLTLACGLAAPSTSAQPGVETVVAETFQALTSAAPAPTVAQTPVSGTAITVDNISFVVPLSVGNGVQAETVEAVPPSNDMPWWEIAPTYHKYLIQNYPLADTLHKPVIYVYPVDEYIQTNQDVAGLVDKLKTIINSPSQPLPDTLPFLPTFNAGQVFTSNAQAVTFKSGSGIRYLTQYAQAPSPITNKEIFYTFQGLTSDGKYYVSAILPINAPTLAADGNPDTVVPAGGVPFDWNLENLEALPSYMNSIKQMLNATDPNAFNPALPMLDALIQSVTVNTQ